MFINHTNYGLKVVIPETAANMDFTYALRQVRTLNGDNANEQELIARLEKPERDATRKFLLLAWSMENTFKAIARGAYTFSEWEAKNNVNFNVYYHDQLEALFDRVNGFSFEYAEKSEHGWCL